MSTPAKAKKAAKPRKPAAHPPYSEMIAKAITALKERGGSSRQAIKKYVCANFKVDPNNCNQFLKVALRNGVKNGKLKQVKGSFKVGEKAAAKPKKKVAKKPKKAAKKAKKPAGEKKAAKPKKTVAKKVKKAKTPKKAKSPAKKAAKPKKPAAKKPAKKAAKKSPKKAAKK